MKTQVLYVLILLNSSAFADDAEKCKAIFNPSQFFSDADSRVHNAGIDTMKIRDFVAFYAKSDLIRQAQEPASSIAKDQAEAYADYLLGSALSTAKNSADTAGASTVRLDSVWAMGSTNHFVQGFDARKGCRFWNHSGDFDIPIDLNRSNENLLVVLKGNDWDVQTFRKVSNTVFSEESARMNPQTGVKEKSVVIHRLVLDLDAAAR